MATMRPAGTGNRALLPTFYTPQAYGAVGDGIADDTEALQDCIDAATGGPATGTPVTARDAVGRVYLPPGTYRITAPLTVYSVNGFVMEGDGMRSSLISLDGVTTTGLDLQGCKDSVFRDFSLMCEGGYSADFTAASMLSLNYTPAATANSSAGNLIQNMRIFDATFHTGISIGGVSSTNDVSAVQLSNVLIVGARYTLSDATTTQWQRGVSLGSGSAGNILDHYLDNVRFANLRYGLYVAAVNNVSCRDFAASACSTVFWKQGPGTLTIDTGRAEASTQLLGSTGGASYPSDVKISNIVWSPSSAAVSGGHVIQWSYGGNVIVENFCNQYLDGVQDIYVTTASPRQVNVFVNGWSAGHAWTSLLNAPSLGGAVLHLTGYTQQDSGGSITAAAGPLVKGYTTTVNSGTFFQ